MAPSDNDPYGREHESVDLGKQLDQPRIDGGLDGMRDIADATSQSPLAQCRLGADPENIGPGAVKMGMK